MEEIIWRAYSLQELLEQRDEQFALEGAKAALADLTARVDQRIDERSRQVVPLHR